MSDFAEGMVDYMKQKNFPKNMEVKRIDIQNIPYKNETFDFIIANSMLYHVPNLKQAISEVYRVLKKGGIFYAATFGENGFMNYINKTLKENGIKISDTTNISFTLQNGKPLLEKFFSEVEQYEYEDQFCVTNVEHLVDYIYSMTSMHELDPSYRPTLLSFYEKQKNPQRILEIKKEYGFYKAAKQ